MDAGWVGNCIYIDINTIQRYGHRATESIDTTHQIKNILMQPWMKGKLRQLPGDATRRTTVRNSESREVRACVTGETSPFEAVVKLGL